MAFSLSGFSGSIFSSLAKGTTTFFVGLIILIVICIVGFFLWRKYQGLTFYKTPITLTILLENGMEKSMDNLKGGTFLNNGIRDYKIKIPKQRKPHILGYIPDFSKSSSADGRLHFITSGDRTIWQQYEKKWITREQVQDENGNMFEYDLVSTPVPRETKQLTINAIKSWRETIDKNKLTAFGIAIGGFIIMVIAHLISLFIQTKIRCGVA